MRYFKALLLTEGAHGMVSQVEGLAKALKLDFNHCFVNLKRPWRYFPINLVPISKSVIDGKIPDQIENQLLISCGKNSIISSLFLKRNNKNLFNIHIQNPKVNFSNFDLIVAPEHDKITGSNVLSTFGALHYITKQEVESSNNFFSKYNLSEENKIVSLILGGPNRYYDFNEIDLGNIFLSIKDIFLDKGFNLILIRSRRTPESGIGLLCTGQIARHFGLPFRSGGGLNSSQTADAQAGYESLMTMMPTFLAGANWVMHTAGWLEGGLVASYEKFIVDIEILRMLQAEFTPLEINEESLAFDAHLEV